MSLDPKKRLRWDPIKNTYVEIHVLCVCGTKAVFVAFNTFSYWYCKDCKKEVKEDDYERAFKSWD